MFWDSVCSGVFLCVCFFIPFKDRLKIKTFSMSVIISQNEDLQIIINGAYIIPNLVVVESEEV